MTKVSSCCARIAWATLDLSGPYRASSTPWLPGAVQVADPFHVVKHPNAKLDESRRRVQNETLGHRGRKYDPLYRIRRLLTKADERLEEHGRETGWSVSCEPGIHVARWLPPGRPRKPSASSTRMPTTTARRVIEHLIVDMSDHDNPIEVRSLGRTLGRWKDQIVAWHPLMSRTARPKQPTT